MNLLRGFVDFGDASLRLAAALSIAGALVATIPLVGIALMLVRAAGGTLSHGEIALVTGVVLVAAVLQLPLAAWGSLRLRTALDGRAERLRIEVIEHLRCVPARIAARVDPGHALATLTIGLDQSIAIVAAAFDAIFGGLLKAAAAIAVVALVDWRIALISLLFLPVTAGYVRQSRKISSRAAPRLARAQAEGTSRFYEYVESVALLRAFGATAERLRRLTLAVSELNLKAFENTIAPMTFGVVALFFIEFGFAITMMIGVEINGNTVGIRYILALTVALAYFQTIFEALDGYLRLRDAASNLAAIEWLLALPAGEARVEHVPDRHDLVLDGVSFAYDRGPVLHDISFHVPERGVTAIVGASGAGKSALANVIAAVWDPSHGTVQVGGIDVGALERSARSRTVGIVFQDTHLYEDSIARNISAGRSGATLDEVREAARIAGCDDFIARLPDGFDTVVRRNGGELSLGERQRIAIARMLLSEAPILVLDECTASLDAAAERAVHRAIAALAERKSIILITHRLGTVRQAANIVVLAGGAIAETGTHDALLERHGEYARLWSAHERLRRWKTAG